MSNYIKSEFYRLTHYKWTYLFIGICSALLLSSNIVLAAVKSSDNDFSYGTTAFAFSNVVTSMTMIYILCIIAANMIFGYEHTNHTLKNSISYGISRFTIYFSKLIVEILYSVIAFVIIIGIHIISAYLLLENSGIQELNILLRSCLACLPLFVFGLATMNCFAFNIESSSGAMTAAGGVMIAFPLVCNLLGMKFKLFANLGNLLPWNLLDMESYDQAKNVLIMHWSTAKGFQDCILIGLAETIIIGIIGYLVFRRMEIK